MSDELLPYYEKELAFIRQLGARFSQEHPKIAGRLGISTETIEDPHISRLIESFAYLNARIQHRLDDDFPEISDALLAALYPHYQQPIPSMAIVQFVPDTKQLDKAHILPKNTLVDSNVPGYDPCRFSTAYEIELLPIKVQSVKMLGLPFVAPGSARIRGAGSLLKISLEALSKNVVFSELRPEKIRFYLKGQPQHINPLYEYLLKNCLDVVIATSETDTQPIHLGKEAIRPVGFERNQNLLPYPSNSFMGYQLLTEYFVFPEKFNFVEIANLADKIPESATDRLDIYIYLNCGDIELEHNIDTTTFVLGCSPVVNLFPQHADPIKLDHTQHEYQIIPDHRRPDGLEIYSIEDINATHPDGTHEKYYPLYGLTHEQQRTEDHTFWYCQRRPAKLNLFHRDQGTDIFMQLIDLQMNPNIAHESTISIETMCSNRDLPARLPYSLEQPNLETPDNSPLCSKIRCLTQPTATIRLSLRNGARWRLISHLSLNHLSILRQADATKALQSILKLYDFRDSSATRALIASIVNLESHPISAPITINHRTTLCRGNEITITLDDTLLTGSSRYLFANILEFFFSLYCSINSFTRVLVKLRNKEGYLKECPLRIGEKPLL